MFILPGKNYVFQHIAPLDSPSVLAEVAAETIREYTGQERPHYLEALHRSVPPGFEPIVEADFFAPDDARPLTAYADDSGQYVLCQRPHERIEQKDLAWGELYETVNRFEGAVATARAEGVLPSRTPRRRQMGHIPDRSSPRAERVAPLTLPKPERLKRLFEKMNALLPLSLVEYAREGDLGKPSLGQIRFTVDDRVLAEELCVAYQRAGYFAALTIHDRAGRDLMDDLRRVGTVKVDHVRLMVFEM